MNDERILKVIESCFTPDSNRGLAADAILAALRAEGFDLYRPDECKPATAYVFPLVKEAEMVYSTGQRVDYRGIPVGGEG